MTSRRSFNLTEQQKRELKAAFRESRDGAERTRLQAVRLYGSSYPVEEVMEITDCSRRSLLRWSQLYRRDGISSLADRREGGNRALLDEAQLADICAKLHQYRPVDVLGPKGVATASGQHWTAADLKRALQQWYDLVYQSHSSYLQLFARCGFSYQRSARVFRSRSAEQVAAFEEQLEKN
jgi:transposase